MLLSDAVPVLVGPLRHLPLSKAMASSNDPLAIINAHTINFNGTLNICGRDQFNHSYRPPDRDTAIGDSERNDLHTTECTTDLGPARQLWRVRFPQVPLQNMSQTRPEMFVSQTTQI